MAKGGNKFLKTKKALKKRCIKVKEKSRKNKIPIARILITAGNIPKNL